MSSLKSLAKKGLTWSFIDNIFLKGITFIITIFLARILEPSDFGLIAIITIFISLGNALIEGGLGNSIIRDNKSTSEDYNAVFYGNFIISVILYPILYIAAPFIANYFGKEEIINLIRVYGITFIISAFYHVQHSLLTKKLEFKKIALYNTPSVLIGAGVGITCALLDFKVWSLVFMQIATLFFKSFIYWFTSSWKPRFGFSRILLKKHFKFGYRLMIISVIDATIREMNSLIIGRNFNISTLGYYNQSKTFRNYPINLLSTIITSVTYPLLSKIQEEKEKMQIVYSKILKIIFFSISFFMMALIVVAKPFFILVYTEKWLPAVPYFQLLSIVGVLIPVHAFNLNIFKICNRTDLFLKLGLIKVVLVITTLYIGLIYGIYGLLIAMIVSSFLGLIINTYYSKKLINYGTLEQLKDMFPVMIYGLISFIGGSYILLLTNNYSLIVQIGIGAITTWFLFLTTAYLTKSKSLNEVKELIILFIK